MAALGAQPGGTGWGRLGRDATVPSAAAGTPARGAAAGAGRASRGREPRSRRGGKGGPAPARGPPSPAPAVGARRSRGTSLRRLLPPGSGSRSAAASAAAAPPMGSGGRPSAAGARALPLLLLLLPAPGPAAPPPPGECRALTPRSLAAALWMEPVGALRGRGPGRCALPNPGAGSRGRRSPCAALRAPEPRWAPPDSARG